MTHPGRHKAVPAWPLPCRPNSLRGSDDAARPGKGMASPPELCPLPLIGRLSAPRDGVPVIRKRVVCPLD